MDITRTIKSQTTHNIATSDMATGNVDGMKELSAKFKELSKIHSEEVMILAALAVGKKMQSRMRQKINKNTGNLSKSIIVKKFKPGGANLAFVATDFKVAPHARPVEFGHGGLHPAPAHPFFRPVVDEFKSNGELEKELGKAVEKAIDKAVR